MKLRNVIKLGAALTVSALALTACSSSGAGTNGGNGNSSSSGAIVLTAGHQLAAGTPFDEGMNHFAELVAEKTDGRVEVRVHPNAQLGNETEMFQALQSGTVDVGIFAPGSIAEYFPGITLVSMPFLVEDRDHRDRILDSGVLAPIEESIVDTTGTEVLTYFGGSQRQMFFTKPATSFDDVQGRLFRVQPSEMLTESYSAMGLEPTVVAYTELYNALQQDVVNGAENEAVFIESQRFYEPAPHLLMTNHEVTFRPLMISSRTWDKLDDELADLVREAADEAGIFQRDVEGKADEDTLKRLSELDGVTVSTVDTKSWAGEMESIWAKYAAQWGVDDVLQGIKEAR
ncbi:TRAP transporter substrate-binding protein [Microbacterium sp. YY-01]|uniref:TRAP transporter substrate-binding protein n=1 Tax=Microbacterium sp. YY-01 TaxID=3421634 RepID=UPI003D18334F